MKKLITVLFTMLMVLSLTSPVYAKNDKNYDALVDSFESLVEFEKKENIDVVKNLKDMIKDFEEALNDDNLQDFQIVQYNEQIQFLEENIQTLDNLKKIYNEYGSFNKMKEELNNSVISTDIVASSLTPEPYDPCYPDYTNLMAVLTYFNLKGYKLSAELLLRFGNNTVIDSTYIPNIANTSQIKATTWFASNKPKTVSGSGEFTSGDLYYSINKFNYSFWYEWGLKYMKISDRYDFKPDTYGIYPTAQQVAVQAMYNGQVRSCFLPFITTIHLSTN